MRPKLPILLILALPLLLALGSISCHKGSTAGTTGGSISPVDSRVEMMIERYDKLMSEYVRVSKKLKDGDVSITVKYIDLKKRTEEESALLGKASDKMTPEQAQRLASISARAAPYREN